jgi:hypothetical protein
MFDLDRITIDFPCPSCGFQNPATIKQARLRDAVICRGCKANIRLDDQMNECRKAVRQVRKSLRQLEDQMKNITINIRL